MKREEKVSQHPSFGAIRLSRVQGGHYLFGSSVQHQNLVMLEVYEAEAVEDEFTKETRTHNKKQIVQVLLSNAQFAEFISQWNMGEGVPCTLSRRPIDGFTLASFSAPPPERTTRETFQALVDETVDEVTKDINDAMKEILEIVEPRLTKKEKDRLRSVMSKLENAGPNLKFARKVLHESLEKMLARGKVEMEAAGRSLLQRMGVGALTEQAMKLLPALDLDEKEK